MRTHRWDCPDPLCDWWAEVEDPDLNDLWVMADGHRAEHEHSARAAREDA